MSKSETTKSARNIFASDWLEDLFDAPSGRTTNVWDYENRLIGVALPSGARVTMAYNADFLSVLKES